MLPKLMCCFFSGAKASLPTPYRRSSFPASCAPRYSVYASMGNTHSCCKGCSCVYTWIDQCRVYPRWVHTDNAVLLLWYDACKVPVSFSLGKMGGLQYGEGSTQFILMGVDGFMVKGSWGRRLLAVAGEVTQHGRAHPYSWSITIVSLRSKESEEATEVSGKPNS